MYRKRGGERSAINGAGFESIGIQIRYSNTRLKVDFSTVKITVIYSLWLV